MALLSINGSKLREDRESQGLSREAVVESIAENGSYRVSVSTLRRAEEGRVSERSLRSITQVYGQTTSRYLESDTANIYATDFDLSGEWLVFYIEQDVGTEPYIAREKLLLRQFKNKIEGVYHPLSSDHPSGYTPKNSFVLEGTYAGDCVYGQYYKEGAEMSIRNGTFHLKVIRYGDWAEGFCTFFSDDDTVAISNNIWIRKTSKEFMHYQSFAEKFLKDNMFIRTAPMSVLSISGR